MRVEGQQRPVRSTTRRGAWADVSSRAVRVRGELLYAGSDVLFVTLSVAGALLLRYAGDVPRSEWEPSLGFAAIASVVVVVVHAAAGLYGRIWRYASVVEARRLLQAGAVSTVLLTAFVAVGPRLVPISVAFAGVVLSTMTIGLTRFQSRLFAMRRQDERPTGLRVVVVGANASSASLVRQMHSDVGSGLVPVAIVDDDTRLIGGRIHGVRVVGDTSQLYEVCRSEGAHQVLLAVPDASRSLVRQVADAAEAAGAAMRVVPDLAALVRDDVVLADVRDVQIEDLLGREQVTTDLAAVTALLEGRRVLVTGAGGSIGSEIARQVARCSPAALVLLDHDETHLHDVSATLRGAHVQALVDLRDAEQVEYTLRRHRPDVIFHAAAHKHVPILEEHPDEALRTNVVGTRTLLDACRAAGVETFVLISTDKAVQPSSVMGASKALAEQVVLQGGDDRMRCCAVRFGNVLGSRGSVIPTFLRQIEAGGPVTVTDPRMTRYFMSIPEAVQLVLQAAALAEGGEVFMLEMGEAVPILELAKRMIRLSGRRVGVDIELRFTGIRHGEKLHEELHTADELLEPTTHPSIVRLRPHVVPQTVLDLCVRYLSRLARDHDADELRSSMLAFTREPERMMETMVVELPATTGGAAWSPSTT